LKPLRWLRENLDNLFFGKARRRDSQIETVKSSKRLIKSQFIKAQGTDYRNINPGKTYRPKKSGLTGNYYSYSVVQNYFSKFGQSQVKI